MKTRTLTLLVLTVALALATSAPALAESGTGTAADNEAVAVNGEDGESLFRVAFSIRRVNGDVVDDSNLAYAYASCDACRTLAAAIQVVLVMSAPNVVVPLNEAVAVNYRCTDCETAALAYQHVLSSGGPVRFTSTGNARIAEIRREFRALERSDLPLVDAVARAETLAAELDEVLAAEVVPAGSAGRSPSETAGDSVTTPPAEPPADQQPTNESEPSSTDGLPAEEDGTALPGEPAEGAALPEPETGGSDPTGEIALGGGQ